MALALYRTYRPGTLADVVGQEHVTEALARALDADRTHHAYLFSGPRGCGKTSTARILARSLNCEQGPTSTPCGTCRSCVDLAPNGPGSIDVVELDAATHRGIDDAKDLRDKAIYAPAASRYRVYILDEAHQLTPEASNALLKLIEEPPAHLRFIFATTEPDKIIATIRSRTFHYPFRLVPARTLTEHLARVCAAEGVPAEPAALSVVARAGAGSVRDSLSVLGQLVAGAGPQGLRHAEAVHSLGITDDALIDGFVEALSAGSVSAMLTVVDGVISAGHDPRRFVSDVLDRLRDLIVLHADPGALESGLIDLPDEAGERLAAQVGTLSLAELSHAADQVSAALSEVKGATAPRLHLELLCARLALHHPGDGLGAVLARLERLERQSAGARGHEPVIAREGSPRAGTSVPDTGRQAEPSSAEPMAGDPGLGESAPGDLSPPTGSAASDGPPETPASAASVRREGRPRSGSAASGRTPPPPPRPPTLSSQRPAGPGSGAATGPGAPATDAQPTVDQPRDALAANVRSADEQPAIAQEAAAVGERRTTGDPRPTGGAAAAGQTQLARLTEAWPSVLARLGKESRVAWAAFAEARPLSLSEGALAVAVPDAGKVAAITQRGHDLRLREALLAVLQLDVTIDVVLDAGAAAPRSREASGTSAARGRSEPRATASRLRPPVASAPRAAVPSSGEEPAEPDEPSEDDPTIDDVDGLELVTRELGARTISEIEHT